MTTRRIFNPHRKYDAPVKSLFLQEPNGLVDTIHKTHPDIWELYKKMKSLDWDENEFDYSPCAVEFETCSPSVYEMMIKTLAWQWEADSVASLNIIPIVAPFVSSSELWALWMEINKNEILHSLTYSEIVRNSFKNPNEVMGEILAETKALQRLEGITQALNRVYQVSHELALGMIDRDDPKAYDAILLYVVTILILERIQFMASFAITFALADSGMFLPIGKAVQKICTDEYTIHIQAGKAILRNELSTQKGVESFERIKESIHELLKEVVESELSWTDYMFSGGRELVGVNADLIKQWVLYGATELYGFLKLDNPFESVNKNPLSYMNDWIDINKNQPSPQEEKTGNYLLSGIKKTDVGQEFDIDF